MKYLKVWVSFQDVISPLKDDEAGRLFRAMLDYAGSGKEPENLTGRESILWPAARQQIDLAAEKNEKLRQNGARGGRPPKAETKENQTKPNETKENQTKAVKKRKEIERNEKERNEISSSFIDDDEAQKIQHEHDWVLDAAEDAGFKMSNDVRAALIALYAENGMEKMLAGMKACAEHGAPTLAYLRGCLKGEPKKQINPYAKKNPATSYGQRDYGGEQEDAIRRMIESAGA